MTDTIPDTGAISIPGDFTFGAVPVERPLLDLRTLGGADAHFGTEAPSATAPPPPPLGPLAAFSGAWTGTGFNTIFRPDGPVTPTVLPVPVPAAGRDNILELNLTSETLIFSPSLGSIPNRGMVQADVFLNGVPYLQTINDVTTAGRKVGIHVEPGLWVIVPSTTDPAEGQTLVRMASIPHGTTITAQGTFTTKSGPPTIPSVDITPTIAATGAKVPKFASQTAATPGTPRIPQDLSAFIKAETITQDMLNDPNSVLRNHLHGQTILSTTQITIATAPASPLFGGGIGNIAFLLGDSAGARPNAKAVQMTATFWIETVQHVLSVPPFKPGQAPLIIEGQAVSGRPAPRFSVLPPHELTAPRTITVTSTQIQYSQEIALVFNALSWPHVSVATLVPATAIPVPASAWA